MHVVAGSSVGGADQDKRRAAAQAGARYVLAGALDKMNDRLRYTAQLFDGASGNELWSTRYDDEGVDPKAPGPDIATRIYDAVAGLEGRLYAERSDGSWSKDEASLDAWAEQAVINTPNPPPWYYESLAWGYYIGQRYDDALEAVSRYKADFPAPYAAICVRLGRLDEARRAIGDPLKAGTKLSIAKEGSTPQIESQRAAYLSDLRAAGVPES
jgi:hypothetical protein